MSLISTPALVTAEAVNDLDDAPPSRSVIDGEAVPGLFSFGDFCRWADISRSSAYNEVKAGRLKITKFGSTSRVTGPNALKWRNSLPDADLRNAA